MLKFLAITLSRLFLSFQILFSESLTTKILYKGYFCQEILCYFLHLVLSLPTILYFCLIILQSFKKYLFLILFSLISFFCYLLDIPKKWKVFINNLPQTFYFHIENKILIKRPKYDLLNSFELFINLSIKNVIIFINLLSRILFK